jgi:curli biogenesis system outer membrane secretion channel CsgG
VPIKRLLVAVAVSAATALSFAAPAHAQFGMDRKQPKNAATPELPRCATPLGAVSIREPENRWWTELGLSNPETLIKLMVSRSGCFRVVDRGGGLEMRGIERDLGDSGELQRGSNIGRGQVKAADFIIVPDIVNSDSNAGGSAVTGLVGGLVGGQVGGLIGGIRTQRAQAQALLTLVDSRTTEQIYVAEGVAQKTNIGFGAGGGLFGSTGLGAAVGGGYSDTDIGKVITAAYFNAYVDLVGYVQGMQPGAAQANAPIQAYRATSATTLRSAPSPQARAVRAFNVGDLVYPTGQKNGIWWEADDENGNRGWLTSTTISPR